MIGTGGTGGSGWFRWKASVILPARRRYQSLGRIPPSASSVSQYPWSGASVRREAALNMAVPSFTSSNDRTLSIGSPEWYDPCSKDRPPGANATYICLIWELIDPTYLKPEPRGISRSAEG